MRNIKITIEYDGTAYCGWERQKNGVAIQEVLEKAVRGVTGKDSTVYASGRTDAGVHALGQVAHFGTPSDLPTERFLLALNAHLPNDIVVKRLEDAAPGFHARYDAKSKIYRYTILNSRIGSALNRDRVYQSWPQLDEQAMAKAAEHLVGEHDFRSFTSEARVKKNTERTILALDVRREGETVTVTVEATGFLYNMVRAIVGTLMDVGRGKTAPDDLPKILQARDRARAGQNAPARGLCLMGVKY